jgi:hypothetical protein
LKAVFDALPDEPLEPIEHPTPAATAGRLGNGVVKRAVVKVLTAPPVIASAASSAPIYLKQNPPNTLTH